MSSPHCFENPPKVSPSYETGKVEELGGLQTYVTGPRDSKLKLSAGYEAPNLRKLADKVADTGYLVVVPDFFDGDPANLEDPKFDRELWRQTHNPDKGCEDAKTVIAALTSKGVSAIGAAGFCWGGMVVVKLAKFDCIQAAVVLHPGPVTVDEINDVRVPLALLGAEIDKACSPEEMKHFGHILAQKSEFDSFVKIFPGVSHGWTLRYDTVDESAVNIAEEGHVDMLNWLTKYIK